MNLLDVTILTASLINFVFSATVYLHSRRKLVETIFAVFALSVSMWALATFLMTTASVSFEAFKAGAALHYLSGNLVFWSLLWFSVLFSFRGNHSLFLPMALSLANGLILILIVSSPFLFRSMQEATLLADRIMFRTSGYVILSGMTIGMFAVSQIFLARKYLFSAGEEKTQLGGIILATSIAGSLGLFTNLILPGFGNFSLFYLGPIISTPLFVGIMVYAIIRYKLFSLRVITAEIFTALLMISLAVDFLSSTTSLVAGTRSVIFLVAGIFCFLLIRSVYREIRAREEIEKLNRTMSEFVAITSHQIRTPLTHVKDALSLIREGDYGQIDPRAIPILNFLYASTGRLIALVNDILDMSRMESGKMQYVFSEFDLGELVDSIAGEFRIPATDKGVAIIWRKESIPISVWGDREKLRQVVFNLVDNALKYTQKGAIQLNVANEADFVELSVKDSGAGMSKDTAQQLFTKFSRGATGTQGTGLGLYVAKRIVEDHKAELWAESEGEGKGSVFHLRLPTKKSIDSTVRVPLHDSSMKKAA